MAGAGGGADVHSPLPPTHPHGPAARAPHPPLSSPSTSPLQPGGRHLSAPSTFIPVEQYALEQGLSGVDVEWLAREGVLPTRVRKLVGTVVDGSVLATSLLRSLGDACAAAGISEVDVLRLATPLGPADMPRIIPRHGLPHVLPAQWDAWMAVRSVSLTTLATRLRLTPGELLALWRRVRETSPELPAPPSPGDSATVPMTHAERLTEAMERELLSLPELAASLFVPRAQWEAFLAVVRSTGVALYGGDAARPSDTASTLRMLRCDVAEVVTAMDGLDA
jgi:hypothetical protein